jgi:HD superfamily phosphodiesterase
VSPQTLVSLGERIAGDWMARQAAGHGMDHVLRVLASTRAIQAEFGGKLVAVEQAALLHDIAVSISLSFPTFAEIISLPSASSFKTSIQSTRTDTRRHVLRRDTVV